jgi:hypothetical protein
VAATSRWVLTLDADVCPAPLLASSLLAQAQKTGLAALSIATLQEIEGPGQGALHPSLLTTLVYRFGTRALSLLDELFSALLGTQTAISASAPPYGHDASTVSQTDFRDL